MQDANDHTTTDDSPERRFARISARQHAAVSVRQAIDAGVSRRAIRSAIAAGRLVRLRPGVVGPAGAPPTWEQAVVASVLSAGPGAVASHDTAACVWDLAERRPGVLEISNARHRQHRLTGVVAHRSVVIEPDRTATRGVPVTTVARTVVDLSGRWSRRRLGRLLDEAVRRSLTTLADVDACVRRLGPARGRRLSVVRSLLDARGTDFEPGDSPFEARVLLALAAAGVPRPVIQHPLVVGGRQYYIDLAYPEHRVAIELDGWASHGSRSAFDADRARGNDVVAAGYRLYRFTWSMSDAYIVEQVRHALAQSGSVGALLRA